MDLWSGQRTTLGLIWVLPVWVKIGEGEGGKKLIYGEIKIINRIVAKY